MAKTIRDEQLKLNVVINGDLAKKELFELEQAQKKLRDTNKSLIAEKAKLEAAGKKETEEYKRITAEIKKNNAELKQNELRQKELRDQIGITGLTFNQLSKRAKELRFAINNMTPGSPERKKMEAELNQINSRMRQVSVSSKATGNAIGSMATSVIAPLLGIHSAMRLIGSTMRTMTGFEEAMAKVKAITNATSEDFQRLTEDAKRLGAATRFTASEVAALQLEYAKIGFSTQEILNATGATLDLAAATGEDLATAAAVAGATVRGFGLDSSDTAKVVDVMAKSFSSSALNLERFSESMKYVAPVAASLGIPIEKVTAQLSALADAGIHGSMAGTGLRQIYIEMAKSGLSADEAFAKLSRTGLTLADANDEVGQRAMTALLILSNQKDKIDELNVSYNKAEGSARQMASVLENTTAGSFKSLSSAWEGFILSLGKSDGIFKDLVDSWTWMIRGISDAMKSEEQKAAERAEEMYRQFAGDRLVSEIEKIKKRLIENGTDLAEAEKLAYEEFVQVNSARLEEAGKQILAYREKYESDLEKIRSGGRITKEERDENARNLALARSLEEKVVLWQKATDEIQGRINAIVEKEAAADLEAEAARKAAEAKKAEEAAAAAEKRKAEKAKELEELKKLEQDYFNDLANLYDKEFEKTLTKSERELIAIDQKYEALYAKAEAAGQSTLELQTMHAAELAAKQLEFEKTTQDEILRMKQQYGLDISQQLMDAELLLLEQHLDNKLITEEEYMQAHVNLQDKYFNKGEKDKKKDVESTYTANEAKLKIAKDFAAMSTSISQENSAFYKAMASSTAAIDTYVSANAAYKAMVGIPIVGPTLAAIAAAMAVAAGLANVAKINAIQFASGKYDVIGGSDGRTYRAGMVPQAATGIYPEPTLIGGLGLVGERAPELVVDGPTLRNIQMNAPEIIQAIHAMRVPQYDTGRYQSAPAAPAYPSITGMDNSSAQTMIAILNEILAENKKLIRAKIVYTDLEDTNDEMDQIKNDVSK